MWCEGYSYALGHLGCVCVFVCVYGEVAVARKMASEEMAGYLSGRVLG